LARTVAGRLAAAASRAIGGPLPVGLRAWDGSESGVTPGRPVLVVNSNRALRRLVWSPNENGIAEAYITGEMDVDGDLREGLVAIWTAFGAGAVAKPKIRDVLAAVPTAVRLGALGRRPPPPAEAARLAGNKHSRDRDRAAIAHHYDLSNEFYELLLDDTMAYSCAYFTDGPTGDLGKAQRVKLDLICRKLGLTEGSRHLDIGCGWGSLICHAAEHYGTVSTGVTLSAQQHAYVSARVRAAGLGDRVTVRLADYRELLSGADNGRFDAVSTIEMGEHVGEAEYPAFAGILANVLRPGGRALVQQMSRGENAPGGGAFIETYIAPDMHMKPLSTTLRHVEGAGLEIRDVHALREHYDWTVTAWRRTLESRWDEVEAMIGPVAARVWLLYLVGGGLSFAQGRMGVDQILAVKPTADGGSGLEYSRQGWE
jgi:cyclopropane-fatty-acyl-phospholipid synthase